MKHNILIKIGVIVALLMISNIFPQNSFNPIYPDIMRQNTKVGSNNVISEMGIIQNGFYVGATSGTPPGFRRLIYQWNIPDNLIPDNSTINRIQIYFPYSKTYSQIEFPAAIYSISIDMTNPNQNELNSSWTEMNGNYLAYYYQTDKIDIISENPEAALNQAFKNSLYNNRFVLGIKWKDEANNVYSWSVVNSEVKLLINFTPPQAQVTFDQILSTGVQVGTLRKYEDNDLGDEFNPGSTFAFQINENVMVQGDLREYSNEKYSQWNNLPAVENHHVFYLSDVSSSFTSKFLPNHYNVKIKNTIEGFDDISNGIIHFKDPWFRDYPDENYLDIVGNGIVRNRGLAAEYNGVTSPLDFNLSNYSDYQGIFFNKTINPGQPFYSVKSQNVQSIYLGSAIGNRSCYFQNWSATGADGLVQNNLVSGFYETPVVFRNEGAVVNANYKGIHLSNEANTMSKNNQRKAAYSGIYNKNYLVYSSFGKIWCEYSSGQEDNWSLINNSSIAPGVNPSISHSGELLAVENGGNITIYLILGTSLECLGSLNSFEYGSMSEPLICYTEAGLIFLVVKSADGLSYFIGTIEDIGGGNELLWFRENLHIPNTSASSINATFDYSPGSNTCFHLAWENNSQIKYYTVTLDYNLIAAFTNYRTISNYFGYLGNHQPSILGVAGNGSRLTWVGDRTLYIEDEKGEYIPITEYKTVFCNPMETYHSWSFGDNVHSVNINSSPERYVIAWGRTSNDPIQCTDSYTLSNITTFSSLLGQDVQIGSGTNMNQMNIFSFNNGSHPYYFKNNTIYAPQDNKVSSSTFSNSREGVVINDSAQFYFALGDVKINETDVHFLDIPDTVKLYNPGDINKYLISDPIDINDNSIIKYGVLYGITDSLAALSSLNGNEFISFRVDLIDAVTEEVINSFDDVRYDHSNIFQYNNISYQVNTEGIGNRSVKIRLLVNTNTECVYSIKNSYATEEIFSKVNQRKTIGLTCGTIVKNYSLDQNFPNPFNPSSTIRYQIPKDGLVTLKVYNILGKEVVSLVNEYKNSGKYEVKFDASSLASGVYIYKLSCNDYTSIKKMTFLK